MSLYAMLQGRGPSGFGYGSTAEEVTAGLSLPGKTFLVTGCTSGLGLETLRVLALRGASVLGTARTVEKASAACDAAGAGRAVPLACELSDPASVRGCVAEVRRRGVRLDAIVCNAGIMALPRPERAFGIELQLFTNHVGHFLLVTGLLDRLAEDGRVVVVSSAAHTRAPPEGISFDDLGAERSYSPWTAYGQSKLANVLFAKALARRFAGTRRTANALHPGVIYTNLGRHMPGFANLVFGLAAPLVLKSVAQGAATQVWAAVHPAAGSLSGAYLADCNVATPRADADDPALAARLWAATEEIAGRLPGS
jgi:NAD(P)-dependent dehydrogenase (short-subunit alcohol dehydrogenase family)